MWHFFVLLSCIISLNKKSKEKEKKKDINNDLAILLSVKNRIAEDGGTE